RPTRPRTHHSDTESDNRGGIDPEMANVHHCGQITRPVYWPMERHRREHPKRSDETKEADQVSANQVCSFEDLSAQERDRKAECQMGDPEERLEKSAGLVRRN